MLAPGQYNTLAAYSPHNALYWALKTANHYFTRKHKFPTYAPPDTGVFTMPNHVRIAMAGDWGTGTDEAERVSIRMSLTSPDYTIHLGDTYFEGSGAEIKENFLGIKSSQYEPVKFAAGSRGTFALLGNHEMYSNGHAYFDVLLPAILQKTSFFCLQNDYWRIVALDTGYNSNGLDLGPFKPSCTLPSPLIAWLQGLNIRGDRRKLILLTHHQPWSAFGESYPIPAKQLAPLIDRPVLWFWGHEHRMAIYDTYTANGITGDGRCIGHGGMPVSLGMPSTSGPKCLFTDSRVYVSNRELTAGYNGFAFLGFDGPALNIQYLDLDGKLVYAERRS